MRVETFPTFLVSALGAALLTACGEPATVIVADDDPILRVALDEPIMIDPDLVGQNGANGALALPPQDGYLPTIDDGPEIVSAARAEALKLVGGPGRMREAPEPREMAGATPPEGAVLTVEARVAATSRQMGRCTERMKYTTSWAARLPASFPVYPQAAVQEAAGTDASDCALRVVNFVTPVPVEEVVDFYFTQAHATGYSAIRVLREGEDVLSGKRGGASYAVYVRRITSGNTAVDLITSGR